VAHCDLWEEKLEPAANCYFAPEAWDEVRACNNLVDQPARALNFLGATGQASFAQCAMLQPIWNAWVDDETSSLAPQHEFIGERTSAWNVSN
tara:strand:+ start:249 stop:524 length:276 start_codon:yes stop_codon:yes gene_type:complete